MIDHFLGKRKKRLAEFDIGLEEVGVFVETPSFTFTLRPNHTHLGRYTRSVSLLPGVTPLS